MLLLYGAGGNTSAGNDLMDFLYAEVPSPEETGKMLWDHIKFPKPIFALVQGCCFGIASTLTSHADFVYCSDDAFFKIPFMTLNLCPEGLATIKMPELLGRRKAAEMIFLEEKLKA